MKMEKLVMCRICLAKDVRMYVVVNKNLQELYKKLTDIPFVTEDDRPILVCFFCCARIKQCAHFQRKCLEAEELFTQMLNKDYETNLSTNHLEFLGGFTKTAVEQISIDDGCGMECDAIKEEPAICEPEHYIIKPKMEHQSFELEQKNVHCNYSEADSEDDVPLMKFKVEIDEEQEVVLKKQRVSEMERVPDVTSPKPGLRKQRNNQLSDSKMILNTQNRPSKPNIKFKEPCTCEQHCLNRVKNSETLKCEDADEKPYKCKICERSFSLKVSLKRHKLRHTGEKPYKCDMCQRCFTEKWDLKKHIRVHTGKKPYKCEICKRCFSNKCTLTNHVRIHNDEKPYKCEKCERRFCLKVSLRRHTLWHSGEKPYKCEICQYCFKEEWELKKHIRIHSDQKPYKCEICQRCFKEKWDLKKHTQTHTSEKPYKCEICERCFIEKWHFEKHIRTHSGEKPYICKICECCFKDKLDFKKHILTHSGEKPYICKICQHGFRDKWGLRKHFITHTDEKPYKCEICQRCFKYKGNLTKHIRLHTARNTQKYDIVIDSLIRSN